MAARLSVVTGDQPPVKPPRKLGKHGAQLWRNLMSEFQIDDSAGLEMLALACEQLDRAQECREQIDRDGLMLRTKHGPKDHPLLKAELSARAFVCRTLQRLGLDAEAIKPIGRPPAPYGWLPDADN
jgi:P27 family predicted phage terminase small subunit